MTSIAYGAALIYAVLGGLHGLFTLRDFSGRARYFRPRDEAVLEGMRATTTAMAPGGRDYWSGILGFHMSHSLGVLLLALMIVISIQYRIDWLMPVLAGVAGLMTLIAWRCWFSTPMIGSAIATVLLLAAWAL